MIISITVPDGDYTEILTDISSSVGLTNQQYANNIVTGFLEAQLRGMYATFLSKATLTELKTKLGDYKDVKPK